MAKFTDYPQKSYVSDNDTVLIFDSAENANKQAKFSTMNTYMEENLNFVKEVSLSVNDHIVSIIGGSGNESS